MYMTTYKNLTNLHESPRIATRFVEQAFWVSPLFGGGEQELIFELKRGPGESPCFLGFPAVIPEMDNSRKKLTRLLESSQKGGFFWYRWVGGFRSWDVFFFKGKPTSSKWLATDPAWKMSPGEWMRHVPRDESPSTSLVHHNWYLWPTSTT